MTYSDETNRILMIMYTNGSINENQFPPSVRRNLFQDHYIIRSNNYHDTNVYITDKGRAYIEEIKQVSKCYKEEIHRSWIQFWIPVAISLIALFRPEITSLIKLLITLLVKK